MEMEKFREPIINGLVSAVISAPIAYFVLDLHVAMTISVGHQGVISELVKDGAMAAGYAGFFAGFFSTYFTQRKAE